MPTTTLKPPAPPTPTHRETPASTHKPPAPPTQTHDDTMLTRLRVTLPSTHLTSYQVSARVYAACEFDFACRSTARLGQSGVALTLAGWSSSVGRRAPFLLYVRMVLGVDQTGHLIPPSPRTARTHADLRAIPPTRTNVGTTRSPIPDMNGTFHIRLAAS